MDDAADVETRIEALRELFERPARDNPVARYQSYGAAFDAADIARAAGHRVPAWVDAAICMADEIEPELAMLQAKFADTENPMYVFQAYLAARLTRRPLPDWVLQHFDQAMRSFWFSFWRKTIEHATDDNPQEALAAAFGVNVGRGENSVWSSAVNRGAWLGSQVALLLLSSKKPLVKIAIDEIADRHGQTRDTVKRAWQVWARANPEAAERVKRNLK